MIIPRRFLPPIQLLTALEAVSRTGSVTRAADDLKLTQGAISRQINQLEEMLGIQLFIRDKKRLILTEAGRRYTSDIRVAIRLIGNSSMTLRANHSSGSVSLATLPTFALKWLAPRLKGFYAQYPDTLLHISTLLEPVNLKLERLDAAISYGTDEWHGVEYLELFAEEVVPVCSPAFMAKHEIKSVSDIADVPLLHLRSRPNEWELWFEKQNHEFKPLTGMLLDQFTVMSQLAKEGLGVALLPTFSVEDDIDSGALTRAFDITTKSQESYYLIWQKAKTDFGPLNSFKTWLRNEVDKRA
jgi:LysR family glycine cleavage system transcriptional activator